MHKKKARTRVLLPSLLVSLALVAASCGDDDDAEPAEEPTEEPADEPTEEPADEPTEEPADEPTEEPAEEPAELELTELSVIIPGFSTFAHYQVALEKGFWEARGLTVENIDFAGGAALAVENAVIANEAQLAYSTLPTAAVLADQGVYLELLGTSSYYGIYEDVNYSGQTMTVRNDSDIKSVADLEGAKLGVVARGGLEEALVITMLQDQGIDPDSVELVESFWGDHPALMDAGEIDVSLAIYPFVLAFEGGPYCTIGNYQLGSPELGMPLIFGPDGIGGLPTVTTGSFVEDHPNTMVAFLQGLDDAIDWIADNEEEFLQIAAEFGDTTVEEIERSPAMLFTNYRWVEERQAQWLQDMQDVFLEVGFLENEMPIEEMTVQPWDDDLSVFNEPRAVTVGAEEGTYRPEPCA